MGLGGKVFGAVALVGIGQGVVSCAVNDSSPFDRPVEKWAYYTGENIVLMLNALAAGALSGIDQLLSENPDREIIITEDAEGNPQLIGYVEPDGTHMLLQADGTFKEIAVAPETASTQVVLDGGVEPA